MKKKVLAGIMTTAMIMAMMTGCGSSDTAKDTQASTGSETSADSSAAESDYTIGISQFAEHGSLDNCREGFLEGLKSAGIEEGVNLTVEYQNSQADTGTASTIADNFVSKNVDLICAIATPSAMSAYNSCLDSEILTGNWNDLTDADLEKILDCGYVAEDYVKESYAEGGGFDSLFFMNVHKSEEELHETAERILNDPSCGDVFRVKGFLRKEDGQWLELNATRHEICIRPAKLGQEIMIVIGEKLNKEVIDGYWK